MSKTIYRKRFGVDELLLEYQKVVMQRDELAAVLRELCDHQNGCPLPKYEKRWTNAMRKSEELLTALNK